MGFSTPWGANWVQISLRRREIQPEPFRVGGTPLGFWSPDQETDEWLLERGYMTQAKYNEIQKSKRLIEEKREEERRKKRAKEEDFNKQLDSMSSTELFSRAEKAKQREEMEMKSEKEKLLKEKEELERRLKEITLKIK